MIHIIGNDEGSIPPRTLTRIDRLPIVCYAKGIIIDKEKKNIVELFDIKTKTSFDCFLEKYSLHNSLCRCQ